MIRQFITTKSLISIHFPKFYPSNILSCMVLESLVRKLDCCHDDRDKGMCLQISVGGNSPRPKCDHLTEWATELFS